MMIEPPPVEADLLGFIDRADQQPDANREQLDFGKRDLDVAGDDEALVQHAIQNFDEARGSRVPLSQCRHSSSILPGQKAAKRCAGSS